MKNIFLILLLFFSLNTYSQDYNPLLDGVCEWKFTTCFFGCITDTYYINGDTIVAGQNYKVLDGYHYISRTFLLREEINERKIYLKRITPIGQEDFLLYDFSLSEGDSIAIKNPITPFPVEGGYFTVDSIRLKPLANNIFYRHFYLSPSISNTTSTENAIWIEGVGSLSLINAPGGHPDLNGVGALSCFFKNGNPVYANLDSINGCKPLILSNKIELKKKVYVVHTPTSWDFLNIDPNNELNIYTPNGKLVYTKKITKQNNESINNQPFSKGLYLAIIKNKNGVKQTVKLVK